MNNRHAVVTQLSYDILAQLLGLPDDARIDVVMPALVNSLYSRTLDLVISKPDLREVPLGEMPPKVMLVVETTERRAPKFVRFDQL